MNLFPFLVLAAALLARTQAAPIWPGESWPEADPAKLGLDAASLDRARAYALSAGGSGMIIYQGRAVQRWGDQDKLYDIKSATKSFGAMALGLAIKDRKIDLHAPAPRYHPGLGVPPESNRATGWLDDITILHLATHTAGFEKPGGYGKITFAPGSQWRYSDAGPNWLAECITLQYRQDLQEWMFDRVFSRLGISRRDLRWRRNAYRPAEIEGIPRREFGAGIHCNVNALARVGYLHLRRGEWNGEQILTPEFVQAAAGPVPALADLPRADGEDPDAPRHYGLLWWNNADGSLPAVPRDAFWAWGLYDSLILVVPSLDLVAVRGGENGKSWPREKNASHYKVLEKFFNPIVAAVPSPARTDAPYPPSPLIARVDWAAPESIIRQARGSDNWPITWGNDDALYTAYGDGWGFEPRVEKKLSLGFARILGGPEDFRGMNIRGSAEQTGDGARGLKASGMLMIDGVLYMFARNATNSLLAWSSDSGTNWIWADWNFTESFGCPTFLNCGRNYADAPDAFVYCYSLDGPSAYEPADAMLLARVPRDEIRRREAYEFFAGFSPGQQPNWSRDIQARQPVFRHARNCYRGGITYHPILKRYLWVQIFPQSSDPRGPRFEGGFGVFDAPTPWGPWTTAFFTRQWDVGPGETASFPAKWFSTDGRTLYLTFSGNDSFSVRRATLVLR